MICPVCGVNSKDRCVLVDPIYPPTECLRFVQPPLLSAAAISKAKGDRADGNIRDAWKGPSVVALASVIDQIGKLQGKAA